MGQAQVSHSSNEVNPVHSEDYASAETYTTTQTEESLSAPDPRQRDEAQKTENHEVPNGGLVAWTQVMTGHLVVFNVWGYITS